MSKIITYKDIQKFVEEQGASTLITTQEEFNVEKVKQNKTPNYVKLNYKCKCGEIFTRDFAGMKAGHGLCSTCGRIKGHGKRLSFEKQQKLIKDKGLEYVEGEIRNHDTSFLVKCSCGNTFNTTLRIIKNSQLETMMCKECHLKRKSEQNRKPFHEVKEYLELKGCKLLSSEEEYFNGKSQITFIASCGHIHTTTVAIVLYHMKHFVCKDCKKQVCAKEKAYNWNGGYDNENIKFRKTYEFKQWVKQVYKRDNYTCQCCGERGRKLNAHHLDSYNWCIDKRTDVNNGVTLCENCHNNFHNIYGRGNNTKQQFEEWLN